MKLEIARIGPIAPPNSVYGPPNSVYYVRLTRNQLKSPEINLISKSRTLCELVSEGSDKSSRSIRDFEIRLISADFCTASSETNIVYRAYTELGGSYTELGGAFGPIQAISDFFYLISAVISSHFRANRTRFHLCRTPRSILT